MAATGRALTTERARMTGRESRAGRQPGAPRSGLWRRRRGTAAVASFAVAVVLAGCTQVPEPTSSPSGSPSVLPRPTASDDATPEPATGPVTRVVATIELGQQVVDVLADPFGRDVYASGIGRDGAVWVIDAASGATLQEIPIGGRPGAMALDPTTGYLYVATADAVEGAAQSSIVVVDTSLPAVIDEIEVGPLVAGRLALDPDAGELYALGGGLATSLLVIDTSTRELVAEIPIGEDLTGPVLDVDAGRVFVGARFAAQLFAVDGASRAVGPPAQVPATVGMSVLTVDPDGGEVWVSETEGPLDVYDGATLELVAAIDVGEGSESTVVDAVVDPAMGIGYLSQERSGLIAVVDVADHEVVDLVEIGGEPSALAFEPVRGLLYVVDGRAGHVKVLGARS